MSHYTTIAEAFGLGDTRAKMLAILRLRDESGASTDEAKDALTETGFETEGARRLLKRRGLWETPEARRAKIVGRIEGAEDFKRYLREQYERQTAQLDRHVADLKEELASLERQQGAPRSSD